jgi:hypothetical protein
MALSAALPSLARVLCPCLGTALALRAASRDLRCAFGKGSLCCLSLASGRLVPTKVIELCISNPTLLAEAVCWGRLMVPALIASLESFAPYICPHERYFCENTQQLLKQIRITLALLAQPSCKELVCESFILRRMGRCNEEVDICLRALELE